MFYSSGRFRHRRGNRALGEDGGRSKGLISNPISRFINFFFDRWQKRAAAALGGAEKSFTL